MPEIMLMTKHNKTCQVNTTVVGRRQPKCHFGILHSVATVQKLPLVPWGLHNKLPLSALAQIFILII